MNYMQKIMEYAATDSHSELKMTEDKSIMQKNSKTILRLITMMNML